MLFLVGRVVWGPGRPTGRVMAWMGKGVTIPAWAREATMSGWTSKSANVGVGTAGTDSGAGSGVVVSGDVMSVKEILSIGGRPKRGGGSHVGPIGGLR